MNIKRSYFKLLMASAGVGLFLANCTVKNADDEGCTAGKSRSGCHCDGDVVGHQVCDDDGVYGACECPGTNTAGTSGNGTAGKNSSTGGTSGDDGGAPSATGGKTYTAGTNTGGSPVDPAAGGAGGEPGFVVTDPNDCEACLAAFCEDELNTCLGDDTCADQYTAIIGCVDGVRETGVAKRDAVRGCGVNVGTSPDASLQSFWGDPQTLAPETTNLLNCLATTQKEAPSSAWANDLDTNFPNDVPAPWPADSCAKLSCTAKLVVQ
jgi:hypothetical protein